MSYIAPISHEERLKQEALEQPVAQVVGEVEAVAEEQVVETATEEAPKKKSTKK